MYTPTLTGIDPGRRCTQPHRVLCPLPTRRAIRRHHRHLPTQHLCGAHRVIQSRPRRGPSVERAMDRAQRGGVRSHRRAGMQGKWCAIFSSLSVFIPSHRRPRQASASPTPPLPSTKAPPRPPSTSSSPPSATFPLLNARSELGRGKPPSRPGRRTTSPHAPSGSWDSAG